MSGNELENGLTIEVYSDVICPWCFIGKRRLEMALALHGGAREADIVLRPFELNPGMPNEGIDRRAYRTAKFGSWERSLELDARVGLVGAGVGITFNFDRIVRTPNTFDAHRLLWFARRHGRQGAVAEALFLSYFTEGRDVGDRVVLVEIAAGAGLNRSEVDAFLGGNQGVPDVRGEEERGKSLGLDGVPFFLIDGRVAVSGAQEPEMIREAIERAVGMNAD